MKSILNGRTVLALLGVLVLAACADQAPLPLSPSSTVELDVAGRHEGRTAFFQGIQRVRAGGLAFDSEVITPQGGVLEAGGVTLRIPAGAVSEDVTIRMIIPNTPFLYAHFQPHGLKFSTPATLTFDLSEAAADHGSGLLGVYVGAGLFSRGLSVLGSETFPATRDERGASFQIDHFSGYIVASGHSARGTW